MDDTLREAVRVGDLRRCRAPLLHEHADTRAGVGLHSAWAFGGVETLRWFMRHGDYRALVRHGIGRGMRTRCANRG